MPKLQYPNRYYTSEQKKMRLAEFRTVSVSVSSMSYSDRKSQYSSWKDKRYLAQDRTTQPTARPRQIKMLVTGNRNTSETGRSGNPSKKRTKRVLQSETFRFKWSNTDLFSLRLCLNFSLLPISPRAQINGAQTWSIGFGHWWSLWNW